MKYESFGLKRLGRSYDAIRVLKERWGEGDP